MMSVDRNAMRTVAVVTCVVTVYLFLASPMVGLATASTVAESQDNGFAGNSPDNWNDVHVAVPDKTVTTDAMQSIRLTTAKTGENSSPTMRGNALITDSETGNGSEVTVVIDYHEEMTRNATAVTVSPDVDGDLTTPPVVKNKRWNNSRTFKADVQFADDNESVSDVTLEVSGAMDDEGNLTDGAVSMTYDVDTKNPRVVSAEVTGPYELTVSFSEGVYSNGDGTGALSTSAFDYSDRSPDGASAIHSVSHTAGEAKAILTLDGEIRNSDVGTDRISVPTQTIFDAAGNGLTAGGHTIADTVSDDVRPTVETISAFEAGPSVMVSFTVDEKLASADITIGNSSTIDDAEIRERLNTDGSYTYRVRHTPGSDGTYRVRVHSLSDGKNTVTLSGTEIPSSITVDTTGPSFGRLTAPRKVTNTTTPTIRGDGVSDRLHSVDENTITVEVKESNGPVVGTVTGSSTGGLSYSNATVTLNLSVTGWSLRNGTTYDVTVSADDTDESANSNSKTFASAFTVDTAAPTADTLSLSRNTIRDAQKGDKNEVTVTVTFGEPMRENADDVTISPDVNGDLATQPKVKNKRWSDARTFKADIQYTDDNESVSNVLLKVNGAKDLAGNPMSSAVSTTYDVETGLGIPDDMKITVVLIGGLLVYYQLLTSMQQY